MSITRYYTNNKYDVVMFPIKDKTVIERKDHTGETIRVTFNKQYQAFNFLAQKKYKLYRLTLD